MAKKSFTKRVWELDDIISKKILVPVWTRDKGRRPTRRSLENLSAILWSFSEEEKIMLMDYYVQRDRGYYMTNRSKEDFKLVAIKNRIAIIKQYFPEFYNKYRLLIEG